MIENRSWATLERLVNFECLSSCWRHQSVISGIQYVLLISIGSEWQSLRLGSICPQVFDASGSEFKYSQAAVKQRAAQSLCPGVISATLLRVKYSSSSQDKSYGFKDDCQDPEVVAERRRLQFSKLSRLLTSKC